MLERTTTAVTRALARDLAMLDLKVNISTAELVTAQHTYALIIQAPPRTRGILFS
ncbi:hypothetical protein ACXR0O_00960 [Verrucomicrobiota bacterium sgz303538]